MTEQAKNDAPEVVKYGALKAHTVYRLKNGDQVPGATGVLSVMAKPALIHWAWQQGMDKLDYRKVKQKAADVGSLAHFMSECWLRGKTPDTDDFTANDVKQATICFDKFRVWWDKTGYEALDLECSLISETYRYGGTLDIPVIDAEGNKGLVDLKTSKGVWKEYWYQLAAYNQLWHENYGDDMRFFHICRIGKGGAADFEVQTRTNLVHDWLVFETCLNLYWLTHKSED